MRAFGQILDNPIVLALVCAGMGLLVMGLVAVVFTREYAREEAKLNQANPPHQPRHRQSQGERPEAMRAPRVPGNEDPWWSDGATRNLVPRHWEARQHWVPYEQRAEKPGNQPHWERHADTGELRFVDEHGRAVTWGAE